MRGSIAFSVGSGAFSQLSPAAQTGNVSTLDASSWWLSSSGDRERHALRVTLGRVTAHRFGNAGAPRSNATRIMAAVKEAVLTQIDHLITTHWHSDHFGGMAELAARIPIRNFIDHGPNVQPAAATDRFLQETYPQLYGKAKHAVARPGMKIPVAGLDVVVVTSAGETIKSALSGAGGANPYCASFKPGENNEEDPMSVGTHVTFGKFRTVHWEI
jgi:glyoxylase-like metal-dependent hydrolase (beta-lactamase superfamily II)